MLSDAGSTEKRAVALWTLGQLVSATGQVVQPYNKYPNLIDILINFLKTEQQLSIRRETIRVLGFASLRSSLSGVFRSLIRRM
uniref:Putative dna-dependent protein kinase n=1 Tax=Anopheles darlingi TaxID=43151 RepID=A0A2M4DPA8_ANODA